METYLVGIKSRHLWRLVIAVWIFVTFIYVFRFTPTFVANISPFAGGGERIGGKKVGYGAQISTGRAEAKRLKAAESRHDHLLNDKFTIAIATYHRPIDLNITLSALLSENIPSLLEIVIVWNNIDEVPPSSFTSSHSVKVRYRASPRNSLNEKLAPDPEFQTRAILLSDDDVHYKSTDLEQAFQAWRKFGQRRLTGGMPRCALQKPNSNPREWHYASCKKHSFYNMIITNLAFVDISFLDYYSSNDSLMTRIREYVDEHFNCEDLALNFMVSMLTGTGPLLVRGKQMYVSAEPKSGISRTPGHIEARSKCLDDFEGMFGYMALVNETVHMKVGMPKEPR